MFTVFTIVLIGFMCLCAGFFTRELRDRLKRVETALRVLLERQKVEEEKEKKMGFATPMTMEELRNMEEEERINALNVQEL